MVVGGMASSTRPLSALPGQVPRLSVRRSRTASKQSQNVGFKIVGGWRDKKVWRAYRLSVMLSAAWRQGGSPGQKGVTSRGSRNWTRPKHRPTKTRSLSAGSCPRVNCLIEHVQPSRVQVDCRFHLQGPPPPPPISTEYWEQHRTADSEDVDSSPRRLCRHSRVLLLPGAGHR